MDIQELAEIGVMIKSGKLILHENHLYTPEQFKEYQQCQVEIETADLLQLTKKIQL